MVEIVVDYFGNKIDDSLDLLTCGKSLVFTKAEKMNDSLRKDDFAYLEVYLLIFEDFYLLNPSSNTHVLKNIDCDVNNGRFAGPFTQLPYNFIPL